MDRGPHTGLSRLSIDPLGISLCGDHFHLYFSFIIFTMTERRQCNKCGYLLEDNWRYCPRCGGLLNKENLKFLT